MTELLPCPFCGKACQHKHDYCIGDDQWTCPDMSCPGHNISWWDDDEGERRWNTRHVETCSNRRREYWGDDYDDGVDDFECSECGEEMSGNEPSYCPGCGRKVER